MLARAVARPCHGHVLSSEHLYSQRESLQAGPPNGLGAVAFQHRAAKERDPCTLSLQIARPNGLGAAAFEHRAAKEHEPCTLSLQIGLPNGLGAAFFLLARRYTVPAGGRALTKRWAWRRRMGLRKGFAFPQISNTRST